MLNVDDLFKGRHFDREIIVLCVRWYLRYKLSSVSEARDRGVDGDRGRRLRPLRRRLTLAKEFTQI